MTRNLTYSILFIVLVLVQALLMNHIVLFNCAVCYIFIYFMVKLPPYMNTYLQLTLGFLLGLSIDMLSDTPGVNSLSCTLLTVARIPMYSASDPHDERGRDVIPGFATMGWLGFCKYLLAVSATYCLIATLTECMTYVNVVDILIRIGASTVFTFIILLGIEFLFKKQ